MSPVAPLWCVVEVGGQLPFSPSNLLPPLPPFNTIPCRARGTPLSVVLVPVRLSPSSCPLLWTCASPGHTGPLHPPTIAYPHSRLITHISSDTWLAGLHSCRGQNLHSVPRHTCLPRPQVFCECRVPCAPVQSRAPGHTAPLYTPLRALTHAQLITQRCPPAPPPPLTAATDYIGLSDTAVDVLLGKKWR